MITGELKNRIDGLWDIFAAGGLVNPLDVIEQITYLMFIHDLDVTDNIRAKESAMLGLPFKSIFAAFKRWHIDSNSLIVQRSSRKISASVSVSNFKSSVYNSWSIGL